MNKKLFIPLVLSGVLLASLSFNKKMGFAYADGSIIFDADAIQALSHKDGATVSFLNNDISEYWDSSAIDVDNLRSLYEYNHEMESFANHSYDHEYTRYLYNKWDSFKPINNVLNWRSNVKASSYDIVVSLNDELTQAVYEEKGLTKTSYKLNNPFTNKHYYWQVTAHTKNGAIKSQIFDFCSENEKRTIDIPSISNTRDIGGFTGKFGTMQQGLIFRSGRMDDSDDSCQEAMSQLDIQTDLDIRNKNEGMPNPTNRPNYYLRTMQLYANSFIEENRPSTIEAVKIFTNPNNYPVMFHCAVGRDRTGTLAMILQALAGASREYIIHDYYTSMWSVTGVYPKTVEGLNIGVVTQALDYLESLGDSLTTGAENFLKKREDTITHEQVGLTDAEIASIRDIWSGKVNVEHGQKAFKAEENYEGKAFVKIKAAGHKDTCMMVSKGTSISAPYELDKSMAWYSNGSIFDFSTVINGPTFIYADYVTQYVLTIHFTGIARPDEILNCSANETISLAKYALEGLDMIVISDEGKQVSEITVSRDMYINVIYVRK